MTRLARSLAPLTVGAALILTSACGSASEAVAERATEKAIESQTGGNVDIDTDGDGEVTIETEDGDLSFGSTEVPDSWPEDVPLPDDLEVSSASEIPNANNEGPLVSITGTTSTSPEEVLALLKDALSDWEISGESTSTGGGGTLTGAQFDTDGRRVTFAANAADGEPTFVTLGHTTITS